MLQILITEFFIYWNNSDSRRKIRFMSARFPSWTWECYKHIGVFGFGAACSQLTTDIAKYTIGRLRPHFFDVCKPDINCNDPNLKFTYIKTFNCHQKSERLLKEMRLSFPSGHSSFSAYCMCFLIVSKSKLLPLKLTKLLLMRDLFSS